MIIMVNLSTLMDLWLCMEAYWLQRKAFDVFQLKIWAERTSAIEVRCQSHPLYTNTKVTIDEQRGIGCILLTPID